MSDGWEPILKFVDESASFVHGFEAGRVYQALHDDAEEQTFTIHGANAELMLRIAESTEREIRWEETDTADWCVVTFGPAYET